MQLCVTLHHLPNFPLKSGNYVSMINDNYASIISDNYVSMINDNYASIINDNYASIVNDNYASIIPLADFHASQAIRAGQA